MSVPIKISQDVLDRLNQARAIGMPKSSYVQEWRNAKNAAMWWAANRLTDAELAAVEQLGYRVNALAPRPPIVAIRVDGGCSLSVQRVDGVWVGEFQAYNAGAPLVAYSQDFPDPVSAAVWLNVEASNHA